MSWEQRQLKIVDLTEAYYTNEMTYPKALTTQVDNRVFSCGTHKI